MIHPVYGKITEFEANTVTEVFAIPNKRKRSKGEALLIRPIHRGIAVDLWEVVFLKDPKQKKEWEWIYKAETVKEEGKQWERKGKKK